MKKTGIVNIGMGNVNSVANIVRHEQGIPIMISAPAQINEVDRIIIPGVGNFDTGMDLLEKAGMIEALLTAKNLGMPILGICLGMQLLAKESEEGKKKGLGWIDAQVVQFDSKKLRLPHMGWNTVDINHQNVAAANFFPNKGQECRFYFVHSFYMRCNDSSDVLTTTHYGDRFTSSIARDNVFGFQFHPEKSHKFGMSIIRGFLSI